MACKKGCYDLSPIDRFPSADKGPPSQSLLVSGYCKYKVIPFHHVLSASFFP